MPLLPTINYLLNLGGLVMTNPLPDSVELLFFLYDSLQVLTFYKALALILIDGMFMSIEYKSTRSLDRIITNKNRKEAK